MTTLNVNVHYVTRVEGHGHIVVDVKNGEVKECRFEVVEAPRFFEAFVRGRPYHDINHIVSRICGICSVGHSTTSTRATEKALGVELTEQAWLLRKLNFHGEILDSHVLHTYYLVAPDFFGVSSVIPLVETHREVVERALRLKKLAGDLCAMISGRHTHPCALVVGGFTHTPTERELREMRERLERQLGVSRAAELTLGTFHATCARILRRDGETVGIPRNYVIFDADDQVALVRQVLKDLNLDEKRYTPAAVHAVISRAKNELIGPESFQPTSYFEEVARRVYEQYQERLRANNGLDFDDLLMETVRLFREAPQVLARYQERYLHILVDEFQDTNMAQYVLLRQLAARHRNLFVVADEDQSIYRWRGADYRNISRLRQDYPDLATYLLEQNYRSTQTILDVAQAIIRPNPNRTPKRLFTDRGHGPKVVIHEAYDPEEEAQYVVDTIARLVLTGEAQPGDCAVMYRTNAQSRALEEAFIRAGLPYRLVGATRFYARREIKDLLAFLRVVHNPADSASLLRILNVPPRGIGAQTAQMLEDAARARGVPVWQIIEEVA
ncbi:MAG: UvrD-helicase domain-containing protein, partial [Anaerolineae bacterium]